MKTKTVKVLLNLGHEFLPIFGEALPQQDEIHEMDEERANMLLARGLAREHDPKVEEQLHREATRLERERLDQLAKQEREQAEAKAPKPARAQRAEARGQRAGLVAETATPSAPTEP